MAADLRCRNININPTKIELDVYVEDVAIMPAPNQALRAVITMWPLRATLGAIPASFWQRLRALVCETEPPRRDWAAYAARPIEARKGAPDWIRERNEVLNRNPLVRIHPE